MQLDVISKLLKLSAVFFIRDCFSADSLQWQVISQKTPSITHKFLIRCKKVQNTKNWPDPVEIQKKKMDIGFLKNPRTSKCPVNFKNWIIDDPVRPFFDTFTHLTRVKNVWHGEDQTCHRKRFAVKFWVKSIYFCMQSNYISVEKNLEHYF